MDNSGVWSRRAPGLGLVPGEVVLVRRVVVETTGLRVRDANLTTLERVGGVAHQRHAAHLRIRVLAGGVGILKGVAQVARLERGPAVGGDHRHAAQGLVVGRGFRGRQFQHFLHGGPGAGCEPTLNE